MDNYEEYSLKNTTNSSRVVVHHRFEEYMSSTFRVQDKAKKVSSKKGLARKWPGYSSTLKMEAVYSSEM
jgi:hypothetical protein